MRPGLRAILGQRQPRFRLADIFTTRRILLVSLAKGTIGPEAAALLGSLVTAQLWAAALARAGVPSRQRHPVMIHIDEVQDYLRLPGDLGDALAQARGLGVGYTLAHQHLGQLPTGFREAVLANARSRVVFGLSGKDAREFAALSGSAPDAADFEALPAFHAYARTLHHNALAPWASLTTRPLPPALRSAAVVRARSQARYGQKLSDVEAALLAFGEQATPPDSSFGRADRSHHGDPS